MPPHVKLESPHPAHPLHRSYKSIGEMLTEDLRKTILSGAVEEGEYLRQRSLARRYGVSEVVVREALRHLEAEGLVETEPRKGARVTRLSAAEVRELWELRILLEKHLAQLAVPAFQPEDLARGRGADAGHGAGAGSGGLAFAEPRISRPACTARRGSCASCASPTIYAI